MIEAQQCVETVPITAPVVPSEVESGAGPERSTILIADDDPDCREVVCRLLRGAGCQARAVASGRKALAEIAKREIGLVVTDMHMPDGNGMQLIERIVEARPELEIIVFSGHATDATRRRAHELGCRAVIAKPGSSELLRSVHQALGQDRTERLAAEGRPVQRPDMGRVLLVDDHREFTTVVRKVLEKRGYRTTLAHDGVEALERFAPGAFDLVLMDINMPRMGGVQTIEKMRSVDRAVAIMLVSGEGSAKQVGAAMSAGAGTMLPKPFKLAVLERRVREQVATTRRRRQRVAREEQHRQRRSRRSAPKKALRWLQSPRTARKRRKMAVAAAAGLLALLAGTAAVSIGDWTLNAGRWTTAFVERFEGRLDRLEGYLARDERRELGTGGRRGALGRMGPSGSSGIGIAENSGSRLDRLEGYLVRDEQRELGGSLVWDEQSVLEP